MPAIRAPTATALRSTPSPNGPVCRIDFAKSGRRATAPPKSTANRSSVIAPRMIGVARMKRMPPSRLCQLGGAGSTRSTISGREIGRSMSDDRTSIAIPTA